MALQPLTPTSSAQTFENMSVLMVEDNMGMRGTIKAMLNGFGITKIEIAQRAAEAHKKIATRQFDLVLCDYMLDMDGMTGQELLEEARLTKVLPPETIFIMTTAERVYEKVVAAAEYGPDDYIIKPFSPDVLRMRLLRAIERKQSLADVNKCIGKRDLDAAIGACDTGMKQNPRFVVDYLRIKAEVFLQQERNDDAQGIYEDILKHKAVPWARFGMAQVLKSTEQLEQAEAELKELIAENPLFLRAYDSLAKIQRDQGNFTDAQQTLQKAADRSNSIARVLEIGELARQNGDLVTAEIMLTKAVSRAGVSEIVKPSHVLELATVKSEMGKDEEALSVLVQGKRAMPGMGMGLTATVVEARIYAEKGNHEHARKMLDQALEQIQNETMSISSELAPEVIKACLILDHPQTMNLAQMILEQHSDDKLRAIIENLFIRHGKSNAFANASEEALKAVTLINNNGVQAASRGDFITAVGLLTDAYTKMPGNMRVGVNLCKILIASLERQGFAPQYAAQAEEILAKLATVQETEIRQQVQVIKQKLIQILKQQGQLWRN